MTVEVSKEEWKSFFERLSRELYRWQTSIEVVSRKFGRRFLVNQFPFLGITSEINRNGQNIIELMVGDLIAHQTHTILNPLRVLYLQSEKLPGRLIAIEDEAGDKTLINLQKPLLNQISFGECQANSLLYWKSKKLF